MFRPKLVDCLKSYSYQQFMSDLTSGIIVGVVAIPLAIAFAIASGVSPEKGLVTAVVGGFLVSLLGGSRVQIGGPTGAFVIILYGIVEQHGVGGLATATLMAGLILVAMGVSGLGAVIKFIPYPVTIGFTSGIAVVIFTSQIRDLFGMSVENLPADFFGKWVVYVRSLNSVNWQAALVGALSLCILILWPRVPRVSRRFPGSLVALLVSVLGVHLLGLNVETIGSRFGEIPSMLPLPVLPDFHLGTIQALIPPAISIAFLGAIEALLSAVVADGMIGGKHRSNMELVAQGMANIASPLFGGIPSTGAIARTATNIRNGGRTPVAGIVHAFVVLLIMIFLGKWVKLVPLAALAAVLVMVSYHMSEVRTFVGLWKSPRSDVAVLIATFLLTVLTDLTIAIQAGIVMSVFLFMRRLAKASGVEIITRELTDGEDCEGDQLALEKQNVPSGVEVYEVNGPFFFGTAFKFEEAVGINGKDPNRVRILRMRNVPIIDSTGLHALKTFAAQCARGKFVLILSGVQPKVLESIQKADIIEQLGIENVTTDIKMALERARNVLEVGESKQENLRQPSFLIQSGAEKA